MTKLFVALGFLAANFYVYYFMATAGVIPERQDFSSFPMQFGPWRCDESMKLPDEVLANLGATDYFICDYYKGHHELESVGVYIGYHSTQVREEGGGGGENAIHPPAHCLPGSGWDIVDDRTVPIHLANTPQANAAAKRLVIAKDQARELVYYWYQSRGRVITEDWEKIIYVGWDRAMRGRTDGSLVRFTIPIVHGDIQKAESAFQDLAPDILAVLANYVPN
jgi:EpsI family protein